MPTIKDVAKKAGVSVSTVSYALSGVRPVSKKTRQRILETIAELNYHPNLLARGLINKRTRIVALLYPTIAKNSLDDLPLEFIISITNVTFRNDYGLLLFTHPLGEQEIIRFIHQGLVDGVILMEVMRHDPRVALMKKLGYAFSLIGHGEDNAGINFVDADFYRAMLDCVQHLSQLGHEHIAFITTVADFENAQQNYIYESIRGFRDAAEKHGIQSMIYGCEPTIQNGSEAIQELLKRQPDLSAVIVGNEPIYGGVIQALHKRGLRIPKDFSVIGTMSDRSAEKYTPKVTNISPPTFEMGRLGAESLINLLEGKETEPQQVLLPIQFTIRGSTGRCRHLTV